MELNTRLLELTNKYKLKEEALNTVETVLDSCIESDLELGIDCLEGNKRSDLIFEFGRFEYHLLDSGHERIVTKIYIYSKHLYGPHFDCPVGTYKTYTSLSGELMDDFLIFDWSILRVNVTSFVEGINNLLPVRYLEKDAKEYEFVSYINHIASLLLSRHYESVILFIKKCLDFLDSKEVKLEKEYLNACEEFIKVVFMHIEKRQFVKQELLEEYQIRERVLH